MTFPKLTWRGAMIGAIVGAGMVATALFAAIGAVLVFGGWSVSTQPLVITILGRALLAMAGLMGAAMLGLLLAGPLAAIHFKDGDRSLDVESRDAK